MYKYLQVFTVLSAVLSNYFLFYFQLFTIFDSFLWIIYNLRQSFTVMLQFFTKTITFFL